MIVADLQFLTIIASIVVNDQLFLNMIVSDWQNGHFVD